MADILSEQKMASVGVCTDCGKTFRSRSGLSKHTRRHTGEAPYPFCGKPFFERELLIMHRCSVHGEEKTVKCDVCGERFAAQQSLRQHTRHTREEVTFTYDICGESFKSKTSLSDHKAKHEGKRPYSCQCGRSYAYASGYYRHQRSCNNTREYVSSCIGKAPLVPILLQ